MKNKQFDVLNNGGCSQNRLCKIHKQVIAVLSSMALLFTTSAVLPYSNFNLVGEITANAEESEKTFVLDVPNKDIYFNKEASEGNWKEDATLEKDGYHWDSATQILTLGNIQINCNGVGQ
ncbi:MAG: hypothetical protein K2G14_00535, partial [Ruminococcus sp.]|nr:hypothetical protein [Ruminococcus sp.]